MGETPGPRTGLTGPRPAAFLVPRALGRRSRPTPPGGPGARPRDNGTTERVARVAGPAYHPGTPTGFVARVAVLCFPEEHHEGHPDGRRRRGPGRRHHAGGREGRR